MTVALEARELEWAPLVEPVRVDAATVREWLAPWPELVEQPWERLGGGLRSLNLRIGDTVARIGIGGHSLEKEGALLRAVEGVRVPAVRDARPDVLLLEYVPHTWLPATSAAGERVGAAVAAIHQRRYQCAGLLDASLSVREPFGSALQGLRDWVERQLNGRAGAHLGRLANAVRDTLASAEQTMGASMAPVLVHADFKPMNIGWLPDEEDVVVFDWEFAWAGPALFDLGQVLRWNPPPEFKHGLERGYREAGGDLPEHWERTAELFDLFNLVGFLDNPGACARRIADVTRRIRRTVSSDRASP